MLEVSHSHGVPALRTLVHKFESFDVGQVIVFHHFLIITSVVPMANYRFRVLDHLYFKLFLD